MTKLILNEETTSNTMECKYITNIDLAHTRSQLGDDGAESCDSLKENDNILGDGHFSIVKVCKNIYDNRLYAMKIINKKTVGERWELIEREIQILQFLNNKIDSLEKKTRAKKTIKMSTFSGHHHILQLFDYFETFESIMLITQLCREMDLYEEIVAYNYLNLKKKVIPYLSCIISSIKFLHDNHIIHRDIKAENFLFRRRNNETSDPTAHDLILADFGLAINYIDDKKSLKEYVGTLSYIAPEIVLCNKLFRDKEPLDYDYGVDIWALGVLTYFMSFGYMPFDCENDIETHDCIKNADYYVDQDRFEDVSYAEVWDFIQLCFIVDISTRPTITELQSHPLVSKHFFGLANQKSKSATYLSSLVSSSLTMKKISSSGSIHSLKTPTKNVSNTSLSSLRSFRSNSTDSLKQKNIIKTLSMTTLHDVTNYDKSTFILLPKPLDNDLMNGKFSRKPASKLDLSTLNIHNSRKPSMIRLDSVTEENSFNPSFLSLHNNNSTTSLNSISSNGDLNKSKFVSSSNKAIFEL